MALPSKRFLTVIMLAVVLVLTNCQQDTTGKIARQQRNIAGETLADPAITAQINAAIGGASQLKASRIEVTTQGGVVRLSGVANSQRSIDRAQEIAGSIKDVKSVDNRLAVKGY